jgi:hypothetical protein
MHAQRKPGEMKAYLESNNLPPSQLGEVSSELSRGVYTVQTNLVSGWTTRQAPRWVHTPESHVVKVLSSLDSLNLSSDVELLGLLPQVSNARVSDIVSSHDGLRLLRLVVRVDVLDGEDGENGLVPRVSESDSGARLEREVVDVGLRHVEGDGHGEEGSGGESEGVSNATATRRGEERSVVSSCWGKQKER